MRHLVELHGGTGCAASKGVGQGTTFTVRRPLMVVRHEEDSGIEHRDGQHKLLDNSKFASANLRDLRVLIVDDEPDARDVLMALSHTGAAVRAAATVGEALEIFEGWKPSVQSSDIGMSSEDGCDLIRRVCARRVEPGGSMQALPLPDTRAHKTQRGPYPQAIKSG